jgi:anaerobic magnesium-protoporphyrin IX monomethyl ester cyclase
MAELSTTYHRMSLLPTPDKAKQTIQKNFALIVPPSPFVVPVGWEWTHTAPFEGPSIIASMIKGLGYGFKLLDQREDFDPESIRNKVKRFEFIGIACYEDSFPYQKRVIEICREENPSAQIVLGGPLVTSVPELLLKNTKADYAVIGEGELTLIRLMDYMSANEFSLPIREIKGIAWKDDYGKVHINEPRDQIRNLDAVPFQDFSVWDKFNGKDIPEIYLSTTRGCPHACSFCFRAMPKYREKSVERVKKEIEYLKQYNFKHAWINDLTFNVDDDRTHRMLDEAFATYKFSWNSFNRVTNVNLDVLKKMKERGCDIILYGFEAISQNILDSYRKGITQNDMINAITLTRESGIKVGGLFIIGAPEETRESLDFMINFCKEFKEVTRVKYLSALPGTPLYHQAIKDDIITDELAHLDFLSREQSIEGDIDEKGFLFMAKGITKDELRAAYKQINGCIEVRPYRYWENANTFLDKPEAFEKRKKES